MKKADEFCSKLGCTHPIIQASSFLSDVLNFLADLHSGIPYISGKKLVASVTQAGGFGFYAVICTLWHTFCFCFGS